MNTIWSRTLRSERNLSNGPRRTIIRSVMRRVRGASLAALLLLAFLLAFALTPPRGPRSIRQFNPPRLADLELRMWQAYYAKQRLALFRLLVVLLHEQYRYSWAVATLEAFHLARAAATFADLKDHYEVVLPDLEAAYDTAKWWLGAGFDPHAVARAELAWWVARRIPGENSAEQVGRLIADEYALLYETSVERVASPAFLRAAAAKLRDDEAIGARNGWSRVEWDRIERLLQQSYRDLFEALSTENV